ncbi:hypothetical protein [Sphingomonas sp.]|uniref:hypothetical protein n=1 Tax=Sphingomonas sp. TaxID=28214 RepID=UPI0028AEBBC0|nr:hypothetical protein [Sphingomonas sp.]
MDIFNHFSCHTSLPVKIADVEAHIKDSGVVAQIDIHPLDLDPSVLRGICWVYEWRPKNSLNTHLVGKIGFNKHLPEDEARLVVCKELLHLLDNKFETAQTKDEVEQLVEDIILPVEAAVGLPALNDNTGLLMAIAIMLPRDAIDDFRPKYDADEISSATIAKMARVPEWAVRVAFSPHWAEVLERFDAIGQTRAQIRKSTRKKR